MQQVNLSGKTVFVTGAAGFIGANLCRRLLGEIPGIRVIGLDNLNDYYDDYYNDPHRYCIKLVETVSECDISKTASSNESCHC